MKTTDTTGTTDVITAVEDTPVTLSNTQGRRRRKIIALACFMILLASGALVLGLLRNNSVASEEQRQVAIVSLISAMSGERNERVRVAALVETAESLRLDAEPHLEEDGGRGALAEARSDAQAVLELPEEDGVGMGEWTLDELEAATARHSAAEEALATVGDNLEVAIEQVSRNLLSVLEGDLEAASADLVAARAEASSVLAESEGLVGDDSVRQALSVAIVASEVDPAADVDREDRVALLAATGQVTERLVEIQRASEDVRVAQSEFIAAAAAQEAVQVPAATGPASSSTGGQPAQSEAGQSQPNPQPSPSTAPAKEPAPAPSKEAPPADDDSGWVKEEEYGDMEWCMDDQGNAGPCD